MEDYEELRQLLNEEMNSGKKKEPEKDNIDKDTKDYLDFVAFCISQRLSFNQIELLGKFLQKAHKDKRLKFLSSFNFDRRFLSKLVQDCFKPIIELDIKEKLAHSPFSLIVDNSTFCGSNVCALKVKYLEKSMKEELKTEVTKIKNKIIALSDLDDKGYPKTPK